MKIKSNFNLLSIFLLVFSANLNLAQELVLEMPFEKQVSYASQIVEGKVISKNAYYDAERKGIYTVNTVEVFKVFKGDKLKKINIITPGGIVGTKGMIINPSLKLYKGEIGLFLLTKKDIELADNPDSLFFKTIGIIQGVYRYDITTDIFVNPFHREKNIVSALYPKIISLTNKNYESLKPFNLKEERNKLLRQSAPDAITSISPLTISAGTNSILTITGTGFGTPQGTVSFPNSDVGGDSYLEAYDSHIESWTDTEILVRVPSFAGTGQVRVRTDFGSTFTSPELTINYAHINGTLTDGTNFFEFPTQLYDRDGNGGYIWFYNNAIDSNPQAKEDFERAFFNWVCNTGVQWDISDESTVREPDLIGSTRDGFNLIGFRDDVDDNPADGRTIAYAFSDIDFCENPVTGADIYITETDFVYNSDINFYYGTGSPSAGQIDFETVSLHELGHAQQLGHIIDSDAVMHYRVNGSNVNRILEPNDITGGTAVVTRSETSVCGQPAMTQSACSLSVEDVVENSISIFPNPVSNLLTIKTNGSINLEKLSLYDLNGRQVLESSNFSSHTDNKFKINNLTAGLYMVNIQTDKGLVVKRVIIK